MDVIIGAGVTGLSYSLFSPNQSLILEKNNSYGGYCRTIEQDGFIWDYSGHFFHFQDNSIKDIVLRNLSEKELLTVRKNTKIKYKDTYVDFPFQKNIHQLPKGEFIDCLVDLFFAEHKLENKSFKEMVYSKLGRSISDKFLIPYNEKLYACDLDMLDSDAMGRFFPAANIYDIVGNFKKSNNKSYNDMFVYPKGGAIQYIHSIYKQIEDCEIRYNSSVRKIDIKNHVVYTEDSYYEYEHLISTMPFPLLLKLCDVDFDASAFSSNKVLVFNLGFDKKGKDTETCWIYFPEKKYSFYRVGYYDNIMRSDRMSLYVEIGYPGNVNIDRGEEELLEQVLKDLKSSGIVNDENIISYSCIVMDPAYVHISEKSNMEVMNKKKMLEQFNVFSIGRYGSWTYCSIEDNIKEAKILVESIYG